MTDTPALLIDHAGLDANIRNMQHLADDAQVMLRPHIKTHKSVWIAGKQLAAGAGGITTAKLSEAEIFAEYGIKDIFIANQITHPIKLDRLASLHNKIDLSVGMDHPDQIKLLRPVFTGKRKLLKVLIEINSGLNRCGITPGNELYVLADKIRQCGFLHFAGIFTHAGQVYGAASQQEVAAVGAHEGEVMEKACDILDRKNMTPEIVSVGSTPTVKYSAYNPVVTEIRPGNYVFFDNIQCVLQSCMQQNCALYVIATVISQPVPGQVVIDAGSKALGLDRGAHATNLISGYGQILNINGIIDRISEEHGVILLDEPRRIPLGSPVLIIPNHACAVVNLYDKYHIVKNGNIEKTIKIDARGCSQ